MIQIDEWTNCYDGSWSGVLTPAAFQHPAKYSRNLITRIVKHALEEGWIQPGQVVLDPFSGVACGALPCLQAGLHYVGVELEKKFCTLGRENIALWNDRYAAHFPNWGSAQVYQGDSRRLAEVVSAAGLIVSSPPYASGEKGHPSLGSVNKDDWGNEGTNIAGRRGLNGDYGSSSGQLAEMKEGDISAVISSPPFAGNSGGRGDASRNGIDPGLFDRHSGGMKKGTGSDPANLDHLPMGSVGAVIGSPPYADQPARNGKVDETAWTDGRSRTVGPSQRTNEGYGGAPGQLGGMKAGEVSAVVGSPPFENGTPHNGGAAAFIEDKRLFGDYGSTAGQIGATQGDTFWAAARLIVEQCALILPTNGAAIWVVKSYVKGGEIVDFPEQWRQLCEACGFETVHVHQAMLVKHQGVQQGAMEGESVSKEVSHKSFFRRLSERRGAPKIDFETILCMRKAA